MPHRSHKRHRPSIDAGLIGKNVPAGKPPLAPYARSPESADDDTGPVSRYCNPNGFIGLHGNIPGEDYWEKTGGIREVKQRTGAGPKAVKGYPFRG